MIKSASGKGFAAILVSDVAAARQIWMTAEGIPISVTVFIM